jgi:hypothetical protein
MRYSPFLVVQGLIFNFLKDHLFSEFRPMRASA